MLKLSDKAKIDNYLMKTLKVGEIKHIVAHTDKGDLALAIRRGDTASGYYFILDSVPVKAEENKKLLALFDGVLYKR